VTNRHERAVLYNFLRGKPRFPGEIT
jgi:hypothetical protein